MDQTTQSVVKRYISGKIGEKDLGPFLIKYLPKHLGMIPDLSNVLLKSAHRCVSAGFPIKNIVVAVTGKGASHANALYHPGRNPPLIQVSPKVLSDPEIDYTLIHEIGHYYHDQVVPGGFSNKAILSKYRWSLGQKNQTEGAELDSISNRLKKIRLDRDQITKNIGKRAPRKGDRVTFDYVTFGDSFSVEGRVLRVTKYDVMVQVTGPEGFLSLLRSRGTTTLEISLNKFTRITKAEIDTLEAMTQEENQLSKQLDISRTQVTDSFKTQFHDWLIGNNSKKNAVEWFADLFTARVLGHLKTDPSDWIDGIIHTGRG
jgi:hypothetical protein